MKRKKVDVGRTYLGVVEDNQDPKKEGRVKVKVVDVFEDMKIEDIPWASPWKDLAGNHFAVPEKGKVVVVVFEQGDVYKPEFIFTDHYNVNLESKLKALGDSDYLSMRSLIFDHKTQFYVNDTEGLKIDHKYNNINIKENSINLNLKDNNRSLNIGDSSASQQMILGTNFLKWFDEFVEMLMTQPYLGVVPNPAFVKTLLRYKAEKSVSFLSHHVNVVDNNQVSTVKSEERQEEAQLGDTWNSTKEENTVTTKTDENYTPTEGEKPLYDDTYKAPPVEAGVTTDIKPEPTVPPLPEKDTIQSNKEVERIVSFLQKKNYKIFEDIWVLNIVALRTTDGSVSNVFEDDLYVFYRNDNGNWELNKYQITTVPGLVPKTEFLPQNVAILRLGQYVDQLTMGNHQADVNHKSLNFDECAIQRNKDVKSFDFTSPTEIGNFPISIHRSSETSSAEFVFNYSEGDQVFKSVNQFDQFMNLCQKQVEIGKKNRFSYTLCSKTEFDEKIEIKKDQIKVNKFEKYLPKPKKQKLIERIKSNSPTDIPKLDLSFNTQKEEESINNFREIVMAIQKMYLLQDDFNSGQPVLKETKSQPNPEKEALIRIRETIGVVNTNKNKSWYGKYSEQLKKFIPEHRAIFTSQFGLLVAAANNKSIYKFIIPQKFSIDKLPTEKQETIEINTGGSV
jgi:hypothetical protein